MDFQPLLPVEDGEPPCCQACHRPIRSAKALRTGYGSHCRRKHRRRRTSPPPAAARYRGPFVVAQDPLPTDPTETP